jgi:D-alanine-D-alanine ligase
MDKVKTKQVWKSLDLPTPAFEIIDEHSDLAAVIARLNSVFVKPISEGSSVGMAAASDAESLRVALVEAQKSGVPVMAEQFVSGEEYTVAILRGRSLPPIKITPESAFYDYNAKYVSGTTRFECPAPLSVEETQTLQALGLRGICRLGRGSVGACRHDSWCRRLAVAGGQYSTGYDRPQPCSQGC